MPKRANFETVLSADDRQFNRVMDSTVRRGEVSAAKLEKRWNSAGDSIERNLRDNFADIVKSMAAPAAGLGVFGMVAKTVKGEVDKINEVFLLSKRAGSNFADFAALAKAMEIFNIEADDTAEIINELNLNLGEAKLDDPPVTAALQGLGIQVEKFEKLNAPEKILALVRAMEQAPDENVALRDLSKLIGEDNALKFRPVVEFGEDFLGDLIEQFPVASDEQARAIFDKITGLKKFKLKGGLALGGAAEVIAAEVAEAVGTPVRVNVAKAIEDGTKDGKRKIDALMRGGGEALDVLPVLREGLNIPGLAGNRSLSSFPGLDQLTRLQNTPRPTERLQLQPAPWLEATQRRIAEAVEENTRTLRDSM